MPIYVKKLDWSKCMGIPTRVDERVAEEVLNYLFNTNAWKQNPDLLPQKVRKWRERLFTGEQRVEEVQPPTATEVVVDPPLTGESATTEPPDTTGEPDALTWTDVAVSMRAEGKSWNEIKTATGKSVSTIRDAVRRAAPPKAA